MEVELLFYELVKEPARRKISMHDLMSLNSMLSFPPWKRCKLKADKHLSVAVA